MSQAAQRALSDEIATNGAELSIDRYSSLNVYTSEARHCDHDDEWIPLPSLAPSAESFAGMVVQSALMRKLMNATARLAPYKATVLIEGESGTGKELVAHALHRFGRPKGPFVIFNCSNLVPSLADAQLFGHVRGAFTDAREDSLGYFRSANGGTLFLDEIGELPMALQPKLLRVAETLEVQPVGSARTFTTDVRLVVATNRNLEAMVKAGEFRADLYYRLNVSTVRLPPLRDRRESIAALAAHFLECYNRLFDKQVRFVSRRALNLLEASPWPGNVRQLANVLQSATMLCDRDRLCDADFPSLNQDIQTAEAGAHPAETIGATPDSADPTPFSLDEVTRAATKNALIRALRETGGSCSRSAQLLGVSRYTIYRLISRFGLAVRPSPLHQDFMGG